MAIAGGRNRSGKPAKGVALRIWAALLAIGAALSAAHALAQSNAGEGDALSAGPAAASRSAVVLALDGPVTPASAQYLEREIAAADAADAEIIVIEIDTPGGLVESMKSIVKAILASETPVASYVSPQGARSASAGLYVMYASHVAAMAPFTNTGAATPVEIGGGEPSGDNPFEGEQPFPPRRDAPAEPPAGEPRVDRPSGESPRGDGEDEILREAGPATDGETASPRKQPDAAPSSEESLRAKIINDSVAYIRALAEERGRNADWAERAVREGVSVTHNEALSLGVVDLIAEDLGDLLSQIDGKTVKTIAGERTLSTTGLKVERVQATLLERLLSFVANPNVAVILMSLATTGIIIEMWNPGSIFPGALGILCLILGLYAFQVLPFNWLGVALMIVGVVLMTLEAFSPTFGLAGLAGLASFAGGLFVVFPAGFEVSPAVIAAMTATIGALLGLVLVAVIGSRNHGPLIGGEAIRRREGVVDDWDGKEGWVIVEGERWRARADKPLQKGDRVRVVDIDGLVLIVRHAKATGLLASLAPGEA